AALQHFVHDEIERADARHLVARDAALDDGAVQLAHALHRHLFAQQFVVGRIIGDDRHHAAVALLARSRMRDLPQCHRLVAGQNLPHWMLAPVALTTSAHLSISLRTKARNSSGELPTIVNPCGASCFCSAGSRAAAATAALSRCTTGAGVPAGANSPIQAVASKSVMPCSVEVGTSGNKGVRSGASTATALSWPLWICETSAGTW